MEITRNNKKPTKELRGPDKNQTAGKAGYSRAEQDAQKNTKIHEDAWQSIPCNRIYTA